MGSVFESALPLENAEEEGTVEIGRTDIVEIIPEGFAVGVGGNHKLAFARQAGVQVEHIEVLIGLHTDFIKCIGELEDNLLVGEGPPGMLAASVS